MPPRTTSLSSRFNNGEFLLFAIIFFLAGWLRFENVASLPVGFHGDEAVSGLVGQQILREGNIGPYTPLALGQPTGPLYLTALSVRFFGSTIWSVRAVSALLGTLTVIALYFLLRRHQDDGDKHFGRVVALLGMGLLAVMNWHLHFSRIGFPVIAWPFCTLLATWAALEAVQHRQARWWCITGFLAGLGIYSYNAHSLCIAALGLWVLFYLARQRDVVWWHRIFWLLSFGGAVLLTTVPMLRYALDPAHAYFDHAKLISIFSAPTSQWLQLEGIGPKVGFLIGRFIDFWDNLSWNSRVDAGDGTGVVPVVPLVMLVVALVGLVLGVKAKRGPLMEICLCYMLVLPFGSVLTLDGLNRRAFALSPFLALLAAIGIVEIYRWASAAPRENATKTARVQLPRWFVPGAVTLLCAIMVCQNLFSYFWRAAASPQLSWTFVQELTETCHYLKTLPPNAHVYFYSDRWRSDYETRQFLVPNVLMEDRSEEFSKFSFDITPGQGKPYFVLLGDYKKRLTELQKRYPHSHVKVGPKTAEDQDSFIALWPDD
ncbi:hypothetical protein IAD21_00009 [Abditibacteriota bacterium]|nr:hypothetical protein IAD21_00009 [Abditibacteriota bacterium]